MSKEALSQKKKGRIIGIIAVIVIILAPMGILIFNSPKDAIEEIKPIDVAEIGDYIEFGEYKQDGDESNGKEPIEWLVLDKEDNRILVISKYALDCKPYNEEYEDITWEDCTLREWLNNDFLSEAFTEKEIGRIPTVKVTADENPYYNADSERYIDPGNDTEDKIFLLSIEEAYKYFEDSNDMECNLTKYAADNGGDEENYDRSWWLRTHGYSQDYAAVASGGSVNDFGHHVDYEYPTVRPAMWIKLNNSEEKEVISGEMKSAEVGDYIEFGEYEQDGDESNGKEPIEWLVLDKEDGRILVISKYGLDSAIYHDRHEDITWEECTLRKWLNDDFIDEAFSDDEQDAIPTVTVTADENPKYNTDPGNDTEDKVFLLSIDEVNRYFDSDSERECEPTKYVVDNGAWESDNGNCWWWLRSPGLYQDNAAYVNRDGFVSKQGNRVNYDGSVYETGVRVNGDDAVRPSMWIETK